MRLLTAYFNYMKDPLSGIRAAFSVRHTGWGFLGYACAALCMVLYFNVGEGISPVMLFAKFTVLFVAELLIGYFVASLAGLYLDFSGIKASPVQVFTLIGTAGFIKGLLVAFALISAAAPVLSFLGVLVWVCVLICQLCYLLVNLKRLYDISFGRALTALLTAFFVPAFALLVLGIFFVWGLVLIF